MSTRELKEIESDFWATMRVRWLPRVVFGGALWAVSLMTYSCLDDSGWQRAKREQERVTFNNQLHAVDEAKAARARASDIRTMAAYCHTELQHSRTNADSLKVLRTNWTFGFASETGFRCASWIIQNGEKAP